MAEANPPDNLLQLRSEVFDEIETVARVRNTIDGARYVAHGDVIQTCAQHVLDDGAGNGGSDGGPEFGEDVEAA